MEALRKIAKTAMDEAVAQAVRAGFEPNPARAMFFRGDAMELTDYIARWLEMNMVEQSQ